MFAEMPRFKLSIEYAGTRYSGWQIQKNARTVQGEIDRAVREVTKRREFELYGSGGPTPVCTRSGRWRISSSIPTSPPSRCGARSTTRCRPTSTSVASTKAPHRFHARHDAVERSYLYQISTRRTAFAKAYVWWIREPLALDAMRDAAAAFVGMQNFEAFTADDPDEKSTRVLVDGVEIETHGALVLVRVRGSHFLWKMVRRMVGVLAATGRGELAAADAAAFLDPSRAATARSTAAAMAAPAAGLFLEAVRYEGDPPLGR